MTTKPMCLTTIITGTSGAAILRDDRGHTLALPISTVPDYWDKATGAKHGKRKDDK